MTRIKVELTKEEWALIIHMMDEEADRMSVGEIIDYAESTDEEADEVMRVSSLIKEQVDPTEDWRIR